LNSGWHFQDILIAASGMSCTAQVVELTDARTAWGLTLMMIYFYHLPHNFKNLSFQNIFYLPSYFGSHSTNDFCKGCFKCSSWNTSQYRLCLGTLLPPRRDLSSPVELLKIAPAPLQRKKSDLSFTGSGGTV